MFNSEILLFTEHRRYAFKLFDKLIFNCILASNLVQLQTIKNRHLTI